jgi:hypothetical protein
LSACLPNPSDLSLCRSNNTPILDLRPGGAVIMARLVGAPAVSTLCLVLAVLSCRAIMSLYFRAAVPTKWGSSAFNWVALALAAPNSVAVDSWLFSDKSGLAPCVKDIK